MKNIFKQKNNNSNGARTAKLKRSGGFTLVETLVAISIFTLSILSVMSVLSSGISNTNYAKSKIIAGYLAQEGVEEIRNMRDTYMLYSSDAQTGWDAFKGPLLTSCSAADGCFFYNTYLAYGEPSMPISDVPFVACTPTCQPMSYHLGRYDYGFENSGFTRKINATLITADEVKVTSTVYWTQGSGTHSISFSENLYNWIQ